jgi:nitroreductase
VNTIDRNQLISQLNWRYATKQFDAQRKISEQDWATLEEALVLSPSSYGLQPWKFIVVADPAVREKLVAASWGQRQPVDASHFIVFAVKKNIGEPDIDKFINRVVEVRNIPRESLAPYRDKIIGNLGRKSDAERQAWATKQVYLALGNFLTSAAVLGVDACPMEGIETAKYDEILGLDKLGFATCVAAAAGYRAVTDKYSQAKKVRFHRDEVLVKV